MRQGCDRLTDRLNDAATTGRSDADVAAHDGLAVCGAAYDGVGVPACVASADLAAAQVLPALATIGS